MTFSDIFKSSFLDNIASVSILDMLLTIALSFGIGLFIFLISMSLSLFLSKPEAVHES